VRALGADVLVHDIRPVADGVSLPELLAESDVVSLHVPLTRETHRLIGRDELALMKRDALLINTARGAVVDVDALLGALRDGRLGGAALDVLPTEPPPARPVAPNLIVTPHAAYYSPESEERSYRMCVARVREILGV
jgi:phosphoglycerate dehydrogenase-like enzyme